MNKQDTFYKNTVANKPHQLLIKAIPYLAEKKKALDLGAGALRDSKYLLEEGFQIVHAVDVNMPVTLEDPRFTFFQTKFDEFEFKKNFYDLVNFQYSLPFNSPVTFEKVWREMIDAVVPGGILVGNFFGDRDEWNTPVSKLTFHTRTEVEQLLASTNVLFSTRSKKNRKLL